MGQKAQVGAQVGRLRYLQRERTRHGLVVWYVRKGDGPRIRVRGEPGSAEFLQAYEAAIAGKPQAKTQPDSVVYFVRSGNRVKIGYSKAPRKRLESFRTGAPARLTFYYATPGGRELEQALHTLFASDRVNGEWFLWSKRIEEWIATDEARRIAERRT